MQTNRLFHCIPVVALSSPKQTRLWSVHTLLTSWCLEKHLVWVEMELSRTRLAPTTLRKYSIKLWSISACGLYVYSETQSPSLSDKWSNLSEDNQCCKESINHRNVLTKAAFLNTPTKEDWVLGHGLLFVQGVCALIRREWVWFYLVQDDATRGLFHSWNGCCLPSFCKGVELEMLISHKSEMRVYLSICEVMWTGTVLIFASF